MRMRIWFSRGCVLLSLLFLSVLGSLLQSLSVHASPVHPSGGTLASYTPDEIVARARGWVKDNVQYNQQGYHDGYREDCSGLVSMAWGILPSVNNGGLFTGTQPGNPNQQYALSSVANLLGKALDDSGKPIMSTMLKLQKGDILLNQDYIDKNDDYAHVVLFVGWVDTQQKQLVSKPVIAKDGYYYYDGIEENGGIEKKADGTYSGYAIEHTPNYPVDTPQFNFHQPWPFPYYPGYASEGYYAWRIDLAKASKLGYIGQSSNTTPIVSPTTTTKPGGQWMLPSPKDRTMLTDNTLHLAATAYPTNKGDPAIATVYFTLKVNGVWTIVCSLNTPSKSGNVYACDVDLKQFNLPLGKIQTLQVSFDVIDKKENVNLAPNGVHIIYYIPIGNMAGFSQFVGLWKYYGTGMIISADGKAIYEGRTHVFCSEDPRPPCDGGSLGLSGLNTTILFFNVIGSAAYGTFIGGTGDRDVNNNIIPVGGSITVTLISKDQLQASDGFSYTLCADNPNAIECISNT